MNQIDSFCSYILSFINYIAVPSRESLVPLGLQTNTSCFSNILHRTPNKHLGKAQLSHGFHVTLHNGILASVTKETSFVAVNNFARLTSAHFERRKERPAESVDLIVNLEAHLGEQTADSRP